MARHADPQYDAIVVGARCAGATVATVLARAGRRVLLLDRDEFPSDTVSTHQLFPDALQVLDELGVVECVVDAERAGALEHRTGEIDAFEARGHRAQERAALAG
ncbi:MAG TPA: FAD-dependent monooxygenase, partial [Ornithinibacter sp.]|nr:FAD-dependent monooxygenase [Ornithinibacter sp.]